MPPGAWTWWLPTPVGHPSACSSPAALRWLVPEGRMISLIKPHYEARGRAIAGAPPLPVGGVLEEAAAERIVEAVLAAMPALGARVLGCTRSPILGGAKGKGNAEWLALLAPMTARPDPGRSA